MANFNPMAGFNLLYGQDFTGPSINPRAAASAASVANSLPASGTSNPGFWDSMLGWTGQDGMRHDGWGGLALGAGQSLLGGFLGMRQYGLAKEQLEESRRQFDKNFAAQQKLTNTRLEDRQRARYASNPGAYRSPGEYMKEHGV